MGFLKILKVVYRGDKYFFESPVFEKSVSIIEGPNGVGKSTFFNLIYFGLGGKVPEFEKTGIELHEEISKDKNNYVELSVSISGTNYSLIRRFGDTSISVTFDQKEADVLGADPINLRIFRSGDTPTPIFSDWILEKLGIPVVEIYQAGKTFKLNFSDIARLIYHNQAPDPHGIFKPADTSNFISDSLEIRKAIFQILIGKTLLALYEAIGQFKRAERDYDTAKNLVKEYQNIVDEILKNNGIKDVRNMNFLNEKIEEAEALIAKLLAARDRQSSSPISPSAELDRLDNDKRLLGSVEVQMREIVLNIERLTRDRSRIFDIEQTMREDISRVQKVIHTHQQLNLFSSDTCPYCLSVVDRQENHCVCGSKIDENDYQRFFYEPGEYVEIMNSKIKSLDTIRSAAQNIDSELEEFRFALDSQQAKAVELRAQIDSVYSKSSLEVRDSIRELIEENIFEQKNILNELEQALKMESKLGTYQRKNDMAKGAYDAAKNKMNLLDAASKTELQSRLISFNDSYNEFMTTVLKGCRAASIDSETYLPVINNGQYREASADVSKRFLYYLTLLKLSLKDDIPFPRLLLIDTPETAGIDKDNLVKLLRQISPLNEFDKEYQILLATGVDKYPPEFVDHVVIRLDDNNKLLKERVV